MRLPNGVDVAAAFAAKWQEDPETGCWEWTASTNGNGYGKFSLRGRTYSGHRVAYELHVGPIPAGLDLDHLCRNRGCVNPAHLEPVTRRENLHRSGLTNAGKTHCKHGHPLTAENVVANERGRRCVACRRAADERRRLAGREAA